MAERTFSDSIYRYTDPVRYFNANDPYYYEVDNIPLKQLQENNNFLKDQIENLLLSGTGGSRADFYELKPYVDGTNNVVKVKPGKFTARINDAFSINPLQFISQNLGTDLGDYNTWNVKTNLDSTLRSVLERFKSSLAANSMNTNGLGERAFTFGMQNLDNPSQYLGTSQGYLTSPETPPYPNYSGRIWRSNTNLETDVISQYKTSNGSIGFFIMGAAESDFIKKWRGVARTAIVNVPEELSISIPAFDPQDFFYIDDNGIKTLVNASQRIDLVFIYSKPVDASSVKLTNGNTITTPVLGIVKGAGLGVNLKLPGQGEAATNDAGVLLNDLNGNPQILPSVADENATTIGFGDIKGSFPSPDDLLNISPLLAENLASDNYALIGQSILPVAYVVVRISQTVNQNGVQVITESDLIDIRPFFRTTELSYNERSGLAAATPQVSIANPVATEGYVDYTARRLYQDYVSRLSVATSIDSRPRLVGCGYIKGGFNYGVESVLGNILNKKYNIPTTDNNYVKAVIAETYGYPTGITIPDAPDWDIAEWCQLGDFQGRGTYPNDSINFHNFGPVKNTQNGLDFGSWSNQSLTTRIIKLGTEVNVDFNGDSGMNSIYFVKKTIQIDRAAIGWASDYHVDVQLFNCVPASCRTNKGTETATVDAAGAAAIWVDKRETEFTVFVSWVANDYLSFEAGITPATIRMLGDRFAGFSVINADTVNFPYTQRSVAGESAAGVCIYPTVTFQITGIPSTYTSVGNNLQGNRPILTLV